MKRIFSLILVMAVILGICVPVAAANTATLLYSEGFENKAVNTTVSGGGLRSFKYSKDCAHTGVKSVKASGANELQTGGILWIDHPVHKVTFEQGKKYSIRMFVRSAATTAQMQVQLYNGDTAKLVNGTNSLQAIPIGSWGEYVSVVDWGTRATTANVDVRINFNGESDIYLDDFEIYEGVYNFDDTQYKDADFKAITPGGSATNLYVDKSAAAGGDGSIGAPFNTIEAARNYIRTINDNMSSDIIVNVKGGRYEIENTIELTDADSGTNGHYVIYQPYGYNTSSQDDVILSGGKQVTNWEPANLSGVSNVYKATLDVDYLRALYVNDKRAQRARYEEYVTPNSFWDDIDNNISTWDGFIIPGGIINNPEASTSLELYRTATFRSSWAVKGSAVANADGTTTIKMEQPYFHLQKYSNYDLLEWRATDNFRLENALEFLNEPGEWYHDADTNTLYYKLRDGETIDTCQVIAPNTEQIMTVIGSGLDDRAENIIVRGFTFSDGAYKKTSRLGRANLQGATCNSVYVHTDNSEYGGFQYETEGNIIVTNAKNISFTDNVIKHMSGSGILMPDGVDNCEIKGNAIFDISSSAIIVGSNVQACVADWRTIPRNVHITNNIIGDVGVEYGTDCGVQGYFTNGLVISHNEIYNTPYSAISMGWGWESYDTTNRNNVIEYNRIYNYGTRCQDGGAVYTLGRQPGSAVRGNYMRAYVQGIVGLYHDSGTSGIISSGNVIELPDDSVEQGIYKNNIGDGDLYIEDNYVSHYERRFVNTAAATSRDNYMGNGVTRSPEALEIRDAAGLDDGYKSLRDVVLGYSANTQVNRIYLQTEEQKHNAPANIAVGQSLTLKTFGEGKNGDMTVLTSGLTYQVMDTSVLSLNGNKVTAVKDGITTVKVTDSTGKSAIMTITVGDEVKSFEVIAQKGSATVGGKVKVNYRLKTKYADFSGFPQMSEITISDTDVATVLSDGTILAVGNGTCTITVKTKIRGFSCEGSIAFTVGTSGYKTYKLMNMMSKVTQSDIQNYLGTSATAKVSEEKFLGALAAITESDSSKISTDAGTNNLTKERMVGFAADALVSIYGVDATGDSELYYYTDRADISPALVPKVALAFRNGLLSWIDGVTTFNPKSEVTAQDAAAFLYRFAHPEKQEYFREEDFFSSYKRTMQWLYINTVLGGVGGELKGIRERTKQWGIEAPGEKLVNISSQGADNGTVGVAIDSGALARKITRSDKNRTIVTINNIFEAGKKYQLSFYAKLSSAHTGKTNKLSGATAFTLNNGTIASTSINSTDWTYFSTTIDIPEGTTITNNTNAYHISLTNSNWYDTAAYTVMFKDIAVTEATTVTISSSSIADGETDVLTPIDSVYIYTDVPFTTSAVTTDKFAITGGATIRDVEVINSQTIRVGIDGCVAGSAYTLAVNGIPCTIGTMGGTLSDTISWSTASSNDGIDVYTLDFEEGIPSQFVWNGLGYGGTCNLSDNAYTGSQSVALSADALSMGYVSFKLGGIKPSTAYRISFYYSSQYWGGNITSQSGAGTWTNSVISDTKKAGWKKITVNYTSDEEVTSAIVQLYNFFAAGANSSCVDTVYIDDLKVQEVVELPENAVTVYRPNVFKGGIPVSGIKEGDLSVKLKIKGGAVDREARVIIVQYDAQNRMSRVVQNPSVTVKAGEDKNITIDLPKAKNLKTKIFVMGTTSYEPYNDAIILN